MAEKRNGVRCAEKHSPSRPRALERSTGVILLNLGGPDSLDAVRPFLYNLFSDREIIRLGPAFLQGPIAKLIATRRSKKTREMYRQIGGKSPLVEITRAQADALQDALNRSAPPDHSFTVTTGMRYWHPFIEDAVSSLYRNGAHHIVGLSLYPQYSIATSGSALKRFREATSRCGVTITTVDSWHTHPLYIAALVDVIEKGLRAFSSPSIPDSPSRTESIQVVFSAHSLPKEIIDQGDPYVTQTLETIGEIEKAIPIRWHLSYQSKSGPVQWLEPSTEEMLAELARRGTRNVLIVPISFVSDHIETLYEIDIVYQNLARQLGIRLERSESLNTHPLFIEGLRQLVLESLKLPFEPATRPS